jgi:nicotinamide-nucleotide amidase
MQMHTNTATIVAIGDELISGNTQDTNSRLLAQSLAALGVAVSKISIVGDNQAEIKDALILSAKNSPLIITCGGLGPTSDDITRDVIAETTHNPLELREQALEKLLAHCKKRNRELSTTNKRQAYFPKGATVIENPVGTAEAFVTSFNQTNGKTVQIFSLPGVPSELTAIIKNSLARIVSSAYTDLPKFHNTAIRVFGVSEAHVGTVIESLTLPSSISVAYRPHFPFVTVCLSLVENDSKSTAVDKELGQTKQLVIDAIGQEFVFAEAEQQSLAHTVGELLIKNNLTLAAAESCSGGLIAHQIVSEAGASKYFLGSIVSYSNDVKVSTLGVSRQSLEKYGAVSEQVAVQMAEGARFKLGADLAISITGVAGPDGGSAEKPVGTVWFGLSTKDKTAAISKVFHASRNGFRAYTAAMALDIVRRHLLDIHLTI